MPNYCDNKLTVSWSYDRHSHRRCARQLATFAKRVRAGAGCDSLNLLSTFVPMPVVYEDTVHGTPDVHRPAPDGLTWYDWQANHWGVKWGDGPGELVIDESDLLALRFRTPWAPPTEGLLAISRQFPALRFFNDWDEETPCKGYLVVRDGDIELDARIDTSPQPYRRWVSNVQPTDVRSQLEGTL
jgi:hypothetical protein